MKYYKSIFLLLIVPYFLFGGRKENINRSDIHDCKWNETGNIPGDFPVLPELSIANVRDVEGDVGQKSVEVMVVLSQVSSGPVTVAYSTKDGTASAAGSDYVSANGSVTFAKGEMMKRIVVSIIGDVVCEPDETFEIFLSDPLGVTLANNTGTVTIANDDFKCSGTSGSGTSGSGISGSGISSNGFNNLSVYEVQLTYTGYTTFFEGPSNCPIRSNGKVVLKGLLACEENVSADDDIMYTGVLHLDIDIDICSAMRLPNGEDKLCGFTVFGSGPVKTELEIQSDQRGGYIKIEKSGGFLKLLMGSCDANQINEESNMVPDKSIASIFNGRDLPMLKDRVLHVGKYVEKDGANQMVVEVLRVVKP